MTSTAWGRALADVGHPALGPWSREGRLAYHVDDGVLRGLYAEPSRSKGRSYVWAFCQPLYVPADHLVLTLGRRLGGGSRLFSIEDLVGGDFDQLVRESTTFLQDHGSPAGLLKHLDLERAGDVRAIEVEGLSLAWCERDEDALRCLGRVDDLSATYEWEREVAERLASFRQLLEGDPEGARHQLTAWQNSTAASLRITIDDE